jgi:hypothetical protein
VRSGKRIARFDPRQGCGLPVAYILALIQSLVAFRPAGARGSAGLGAADHLNKATDVARNMVTRFGMHEKLGRVGAADP